MKPQAPITTSVYAGVTYYETTQSGVVYTARRSPSGWEVYTYRIALGRHVPGVKHFDSLQSLAGSVKAFVGLDALLEQDHAPAM